MTAHIHKILRFTGNTKEPVSIIPKDGSLERVLAGLRPKHFAQTRFLKSLVAPQRAQDQPVSIVVTFRKSITISEVFIITNHVSITACARGF